MNSPNVCAASMFYPFLPVGGFGLFNSSCKVSVEGFVLCVRWVLGEAPPFVVIGTWLVPADTKGGKFFSPPSFCMWCDFDWGCYFSCGSINCLEQLVCHLFKFFDCVDRVLQCCHHFDDLGFQVVVVCVPVHSFVVESFSVLAQEIHEVDDRDDQEMVCDSGS